MTDPSRDERGDPARGVTRRGLMKGAGLAAAIGALGGPLDALARGDGEEIRRQGPGAVDVRLRVNGAERTLRVEPRDTLLAALRLPTTDLTGAKEVCNRSQCGACTIWLDGRPVHACSTLAVEAEGREVTTVEGLGSPDALHPVQRAFVEEDAMQCGFCTPGMVMSCAAVVRDRGRDLKAEDVRTATAGNLCRCGSYPHVVKAALRAAREA